jgi:uncharacterized membrane protein
MKNHIVLLGLFLLFTPAFASICYDQTTPVCASDGNQYVNESNMTATGPTLLVLKCGTCAAYQADQDAWALWNNSSTTQYNISNITNRSYLERYVSTSVGKMIGNDEFGQAFVAIIVFSFFFVFVSFQNTRIEGKAAVLLPAILLTAVFIGWIVIIVAIIVGIVLYVSLSKILNK